VLGLSYAIRLSPRIEKRLATLFTPSPSRVGHPGDPYTRRCGSKEIAQIKGDRWWGGHNRLTPLILLLNAPCFLGGIYPPACRPSSLFFFSISLHQLNPCLPLDFHCRPFVPLSTYCILFWILCLKPPLEKDMNIVFSHTSLEFLIERVKVYLTILIYSLLPDWIF